MKSAAALVLAFALAGCGAAIPAGSGDPTGAPPTGGTTLTPAPPPSGGWSGTITFHLVRDIDTTNTSTTGTGIFTSTTTEHFVLQSDFTDTFTVTGADDLDYGIVTVDLTGQIANSGSTFEQTIFVTDLRNALGCHYLEETGSEIDGSWTLGGGAEGEIRFDEDGTYSITVRGGDSGEDAIPALLWEEFTILEGAAIDCPAPGRSETTGFGSYGDYAHIYGGGPMEGTLDPLNPGSVLDGSVTSTTDELLPATITVTWHLVHDGPIILLRPYPTDE